MNKPLAGINEQPELSGRSIMLIPLFWSIRQELNEKKDETKTVIHEHIL